MADNHTLELLVGEMRGCRADIKTVVAKQEKQGEVITTIRIEQAKQQVRVAAGTKVLFAAAAAVSSGIGAVAAWLLGGAP